jgi:hypothetical protein
VCVTQKVDFCTWHYMLMGYTCATPKVHALDLPHNGNGFEGNQILWYLKLHFFFVDLSSDVNGLKRIKSQGIYPPVTSSCVGQYLQFTCTF